MQIRETTGRLTFNDVITTVSRLTRNEREAAAVINHLLNSSRISFKNPMRADMKRLLA